jgi:hypothetical protein
MPSLQRALAFAEVHDVAVGVGDHLHFDVPWRRDVALEKQGVVTEGRHRLAPGGGDGGRKLRLLDDVHPLPPPPAEGLMRTGSRLPQRRRSVPRR